MAKDLRGERCRVAFRLQGEGDNIEAYKRTFEHVHTLDLDSPSTLAKSCQEMFVIGKGVIDSHYRALDKERAELEAMEEQKKLTYRMQNRELEIREELSRTSAGHLDIPLCRWTPQSMTCLMMKSWSERLKTLTTELWQNHAYGRGFLFLTSGFNSQDA